MKNNSVVLLENGKLDLQELELTSLRDDECRVRIKFAGICSSDVNRACGVGAYHYPLVMGHEISGVIEEIGNLVRGFNVGDRVAIFPLLPCFSCEACAEKEYQKCCNYSYYGSRTNGGFAEYINVKAWNLLKVPEEVSLDDASLIEPMAVVVHAVKKLAKLQNNSLVIVLGAGFLGLLIIQILRDMYPNLNIISVDKNAFKLEIATQYGAKISLIKNDDDWTQFLQLGVRGDAIIEATGTAKCFQRSIEVAKNNAEIICLGNIDSDISITKKIFSQILRREITILGTWNSVFKGKSEDDWIESLEYIKKGIRPSQLVTHLIHLDKVPEALTRMFAHKMRAINFEHIKHLIKND